MQVEKIDLCTYWIHLTFFLYFVVLLAERLQSLVRSVADPNTRLFGNGFNGYVYGLTILSLVGALIYLTVKTPAFWLSPFTLSASVHGKVDLPSLCVAAGIILLSGMVHTEYTVAPMQFGAYGALIVAMVIQTARMQSQSQNRFMLWFSLIYLTAFSMAIPVVYRSEIKLSALFHVIEALTALLLVVAFTGMLYIVFNRDATNLFFFSPILAAAILDGIVLGMRWKEQVNTFVLIFLILASVLWCVGKITATCIRL